jgi:dihydrofolate reductase
VTAGSDIGRGSAISLTDAGPRLKRSMMILRVGSASAWKTPRSNYLAAGLLDEMEISVVPLLLGDGARPFDNLGDADVRLEQFRVVAAPGVAHLSYRVG